MRIAVLASGDGWHVQDLARAAARHGHHLARASFRQLEGWIASSEAPVSSSTGRISQHMTTPLSSVDCVLVRTMPAGSLEQVIFRMDVLHRLEAARIAVLNPPRALETAVDKYLACCRLEAAGLPVPPTMACEQSAAAIEAFQKLGGDVVVKPIFGSEGKGITRVNDPDVAYRVFRTLEQLGSVLYLQRFIPHDGYDIRAFVLGDRVLAAMRRRHFSDWRTNVARGATGEEHKPSDREMELALRAARAIGASVAGVDLLLGRDGQTYVLEVNAVPGWRALARVTSIDIASELLAFAQAKK